MNYGGLSASNKQTTMNNANPIWLASYPRSGNTLLRTILWHCFGFRSGSYYPNDLLGNKKLEEYGPDNQIRFPKNSIPFIKTHEYDKDNNPAIYVIRDGRAASVSLWKLFNYRFSLEEIIIGQRHQFGTWTNHIESWDPWNRPKTLLLKYEDLINSLSGELDSISDFLNTPVLKHNIPDRSIIAGVSGRMVKNKSDWQSELSGELLELFLALNGDMLRKTGYLD